MQQTKQDAWWHLPIWHLTSMRLWSRYTTLISLTLSPGAVASSLLKPIYGSWQPDQGITITHAAFLLCKWCLALKPCGKFLGGCRSTEPAVRLCKRNSTKIAVLLNAPSHINLHNRHWDLCVTPLRKITAWCDGWLAPKIVFEPQLPGISLVSH